MEIPYDLTVAPEDSRPVGPVGHCTYCGQLIGSPHLLSCVIAEQRRYDAAELGRAYPISTYPAGHHALFWFPNGERGIGGFETATAYPDEDGVIRSGWTHGGPNSGADFEFCEPPTHWFRLPDPPAYPAAVVAAGLEEIWDKRPA